MDERKRPCRYYQLGGGTYESEAIVGAAHGYAFGRSAGWRLRMQGSLDGAVARLVELAFDVEGRRGSAGCVSTSGA